MAIRTPGLKSPGNFPPDRGPHRSSTLPAALTRRRVGIPVLVASLAGAVLPALVAGPATAAVTIGENISAFPNRDMVVAVGYNPGEELTIQVVRNGVVVGTTTGPAVETPEGIGLEVNHGPVGDPLPGDCWDGTTPDIVGGDVIRVIASNRGVDEMTVADLVFDGDPYLDSARNVAVDGQAAPGTDFAVEFRRDKPDPRFRRGPFAPVFDAADPTGRSWTATFRPSTTTSAEGLTTEQQRTIALNEASWLAVADNITSTTLAELGEPGGVGPGCTGSAEPNAVASGYQAPINVASGAMVLSGTAREGVERVSITVGGLAAKEATLSTNATGDKTWTLSVPKAELVTLSDGTVTIRSSFIDAAGTAVAGANRTVLKDMVAPLAPTATPPPGSYSGTQAVTLNKPAGEQTSKVYWEIGSATVADPDEFSTLYAQQISVTSSQTIKARVIDAAGNLGAVATLDYKIGDPASAPTGVRATEGKGSATVTWAAAANATAYNVYRDGGDTPVNATPVTALSYTDANLTPGTHSYVVHGVSSAGIESVASAPATVVLAAPRVPQGFTAAAGDARVVLSWTRNTEADLGGYRIYREDANGVMTLLRTMADTATSFTDTGRVNGTPYFYAIAAVDDATNESAQSGVVQATPSAATAPPAAPSVSPASGTYTTAQSVTMTAAPGTTIRYTIGTGTTVPANPTATTGTVYSGPINVSASRVIKAVAVDASNRVSPVTQRNYTVNLPSGDTTAPTVTGRTPAANGFSFPVANNVTATFSEAVQGVTTTTMRLTNARTGAAVAAAVTYNATTRVATLNPGASLAQDTRYTLTLAAGTRTSGIRDTANNPLALTTWSFTTGPAPTVTARTPAVNATAVGRAANVTATFSEAVQGVSGTTMRLTNAATGASITAVVSYNATTRVATLNPSANLAANTRYRVNLVGGATSVRDTAGNPLANVTWTFTTGA